MFYYPALNETEMRIGTPDTRLSIRFALEEYRWVDNNLNEGNRSILSQAWSITESLQNYEQF